MSDKPVPYWVYVNDDDVPIELASTPKLEGIIQYVRSKNLPPETKLRYGSVEKWATNCKEQFVGCLWKGWWIKDGSDDAGQKKMGYKEVIPKLDALPEAEFLRVCFLNREMSTGEFRQWHQRINPLGTSQPIIEIGATTETKPAACKGGGRDPRSNFDQPAAENRREIESATDPP